MLTIQPASKQLFCKPESGETTTKSGFLLPEKSVEKPQIAEVINVGKSVEDYRQKDRIVYKPYCTTEFKLDGKEYFLIELEDVLGTVMEVE